MKLTETLGEINQQMAEANPIGWHDSNGHLNVTGKPKDGKATLVVIVDGQEQERNFNVQQRLDSQGTVRWELEPDLKPGEKIKVVGQSLEIVTQE